MTATKKVATDFEEIIQADRQRRKNEALAEEIFGRGRRASGPAAGSGPRKPGTGPSLASRVGISKRSTSQASVGSKRSQPKSATKPAGNVDADWTHDLHDSASPAGNGGGKFNSRVSKGGNAEREVRLYKAINGSSAAPALSNQFNIVNKTQPSNGISIRGIAGPAVVIAENFAPGTTAADIESAMAPIGGPVLKCSITTSGSTVIAELVFDSRDGADRVIEQFHDQIADGRVLRLYHKPGPGPAKLVTARSEPIVANPPLGPRADIASERSNNNRSAARYGALDRYEPRERSRERRRSNEREDVVDGTYGFEEQMDMDEPENNRDDRNDTGHSRGLYSDDLVNRRAGRGDNRGWQDNRNRGRGGDRGRERGRGYR